MNVSRSAQSMLTADSDAEQKLVPIGVRSLSVGASGQCAAVLDAPTMGDETRRNVFVWGNNESGQLGNGKRSSLAAPVILTAGDKTGADPSPARDSLILVRDLRRLRLTAEPSAARGERGHEREGVQCRS